MIEPITIPPVETLEDLRRGTEVAINRFIAQFNANDLKLDGDLDCRGHSLINVDWPVKQKDAVNLEYLTKALKKNVSEDTGVSVSSGSNQDRFVWGLGVGNNIAVGTSVTPKIMVERACTLTHWSITAVVAPTGASIKINIKKNGTTILDASQIVLAAGAVGPTIGTNFVTTSLAYQDILTCDVVQVGSTIPGFKIEVQIAARVG